MEIIRYGLYNVKDDYFTQFESQYLCDNKCENRPYYCSFTDKDGITWFIPISSRITSYEEKIKNDTAKRGQCLFYHIGDIAGHKRVFLIGNMFPVTEKYIKKQFTVNGTHYIIEDKTLIKEISKRASKYLALVANGKLTPTVDILNIKKTLMNH